MGKIVGLTFGVPAETFTCPHCGKEYKTQAALDKHLDDKHPVLDPADD